MDDTLNSTNENLGKHFLTALANRDFSQIEAMFQPEVRFRALVPSGIRESASAEGVVGWLKRWFGEADELRMLRSSIDQIADRLYITYRLRLRSANSWEIIEQHVFCRTNDGYIFDMALLCSGFHADSSDAPSPHQTNGDNVSHQTQAMVSILGADRFYDAGNRGCADGPLNEIARLMRQMSSGQTLEVQALDPSVAGDLPAWCRLAGHEFVKQEGNHYLIRHK